MKILIADDDLISRKQLDTLTRSLGFDTLVAEDGKQAWNIWKNKRPRFVITDWVMPELTGPELCKKIRVVEGSQYTYIIIVTSKDHVEDIVTGMAAGADDFIKKPFIKEELAVRIRAGERILLSETRDIVIFSMAKLAESRDPETGNHLERIRHYSKTLAQTIIQLNTTGKEINESIIDNIFLTSPLHDIGKMGIPDYILLKTGRLDDVEFKIMKTHSVIGFNTLNAALKKYPKADYLKISAEIALSHHEKYDGTGYPNQLKGDEIPLSAQIVSLADVYDALVNKRVYKEAYPHDVAKSIIIEEKATHFNPLIVDAFLACEKNFAEIFYRFKSEDVEYY
ncbi:MAG: response regulator [Spirochaetales bacterium]|nr:response regulator [Spirochaetales bacterium]